jgi:electron transport complex protein RnfD
MNEPRLVVAASPHLGGRASTPTIMWNVVLALLPLVGAATYYFGPTALLVIAAATLGAVLPERLRGGGTIADGSASITGILLGLTLPPGVPLWMAFLGGAFAIAVGKLAFGGLGSNIFNPALLGRAFLQAAFPVAMTTWPAAGQPWWSLRGDTFALPLFRTHVDAVTAATPLGLMKFEHRPTALSDLLLGSTGGSLGETAGVLILVCGGYLALRNFLNWRIPVSVFLGVAAVGGAAWLLAPARYPNPLFLLFSGGLMLGAVFMATDMVTSPVTHRGCWIFGFGIGALVVVIRLWGGLAEGVMYAILLMNALVPFLNRATQPRVFGTRAEGRP